MTLTRIITVLIVSFTLWKAPAANAEPFTVYVAVWRGCEDACKGFQDYIREEKIDVNIVVRDAERDKSRLPGFVREAKQRSLTTTPNGTSPTFQSYL